MSKKFLFILLTGLVLFSCQPETQLLGPCNGSYNLSYDDGGIEFECVDYVYDGSTCVISANNLKLTLRDLQSEGIYPIAPTQSGVNTASAYLLFVPQDHHFPPFSFIADSGYVNVTSFQSKTLSGTFNIYFDDYPDCLDGTMNAIPDRY